MKKIILFTMISLTFGMTLVNAQITIKDDNIVEKPVFKPRAFDSLSNFTKQSRFIDYKKYIGYKLFYLPKSNKYQSTNTQAKTVINFLFTENSKEIIKNGKIPFDELVIYKLSFNGGKGLSRAALEQYKGLVKKYETIDKEITNVYQPEFYHSKTDEADGRIYGDIGTQPDKVEGKYFTILDIKGKESTAKEYKKLEDIESDELDWKVGLKVLLKNNESNDTLYWEIKQARFSEDAPFFLVPYFEKQQKTYKGNSLIAMKEIRNIVDINTGEPITIETNEKWDCFDVTFTNSKKNKYLTPFYFLKNGSREIALQLGYFNNESFLLEKEYTRREEERKKAEEQKIKEEQEREQKTKAQEKQFRNDCIAKYGSKLGGLIADGKVVIGMNKDMCIAAWGNPIDINRTIVRGLTHEQWVYGWSTYLYFDNGILSAIQD